MIPTRILSLTYLIYNIYTQIGACYFRPRAFFFHSPLWDGPSHNELPFVLINHDLEELTSPQFLTIHLLWYIVCKWFHAEAPSLHCNVHSFTYCEKTGLKTWSWTFTRRVVPESHEFRTAKGIHSGNTCNENQIYILRQGRLQSDTCRIDSDHVAKREWR
jgi:hypothetical protein